MLSLIFKKIPQFIFFRIIREAVSNFKDFIPSGYVIESQVQHKQCSENRTIKEICPKLYLFFPHQLVLRECNFLTKDG